MKAAWFEEGEEQILRCSLCSHRCSIVPGATGLCRVRGNEAGRPSLPHYGVVSSSGLDPIEKKPLYHFLPGSRVFSVGFFGCNLRCPYCQNWEISQTTSGAGFPMEPQALVRQALQSGSPSVAFTYSEPTVHFEYLIEAATLARKAGLKTVLVTNGNLNEGPAEALLALMDAVNLDIKCFSPGAYRKTLAGDLDTVLGFARIAGRLTWLEVTTLIVPGLDDWPTAIEAIAGFLADLSPFIPLHISAYHPAFKYSDPALPDSLIRELAANARKILSHVYEGNIAGLEEDSRCPSCAAIQVKRRGYAVKIIALEGHSTPGMDSSGAGQPRCGVCGRPAHFILA